MNTTAEKLLAVRAGADPISVAEQNAGQISTSEAYEIQTAVCAGTGAPGGWKIGKASPEADPIWAPIFDADILPSGADLAREPGKLVAIEVEIAFRIADDHRAQLHDGVWLSDRANLMSVISSAHLVLETVESRLENSTDADAGWKLADNQINGGLIIGAAIPDWRELDLQTRCVELNINGQNALSEVRSNPGGDPYALLAWGLARGTDHCGGIVPGQYVTTGSLSGVQWYPAGSHIHAALPDLGVSVEVDL